MKRNEDKRGRGFEALGMEMYGNVREKGLRGDKAARGRGWEAKDVRESG